MTKNDALVSRTVFETPNGVCITERWNIKHPDCPFAVVQMARGLTPGDAQRVVPYEEYYEMPDDDKLPK